MEAYQREKEGMDLERREAELLKIMGQTQSNRLKQRNRKQNYFNKRCEDHRRRSFAALREYRKVSNNENRITYVEENQRYKEVLREEETKYYESKAKELTECRDNKELWRKIRELKPKVRKSGISVDLDDLVRRNRNDEL